MPVNPIFLKNNMMGPNSWLITEELTKDISLKPGMRVIDLGCGKGLSSIYLAETFGVEVFAVDLWIPAGENISRFHEMEISGLTVPLRLNVKQLPFAEKFFDAVISVDSYHYFGNNDIYFPQVLKPTLKKNAVVAIAFPGMKFEVKDNIPKEMEHLWNPEALEMWHSINWWKPKFEPYLKNLKINEMECFDKAWSDWLSSGNPYAKDDKEMMEKDNGRYMNLIKITGSVQ